MIDWGQVQTAEAKEASAKQAAYEATIASRQAAYVSESAPLKLEAEYGAVRGGEKPDYSLWPAKVAEIKSRYPLPALWFSVYEIFYQAIYLTRLHDGGQSVPRDHDKVLQWYRKAAAQGNEQARLRLEFDTGMLKKLLKGIPWPVKPTD